MSAHGFMRDIALETGYRDGDPWNRGSGGIRHATADRTAVFLGCDGNREVKQNDKEDALEVASGVFHVSSRRGGLRGQLIFWRTEFYSDRPRDSKSLNVSRVLVVG